MEVEVEVEGRGLVDGWRGEVELGWVGLGWRSMLEMGVWWMDGGEYGRSGMVLRAAEGFEVWCFRKG